jgi:hypothetical protein
VSREVGGRSSAYLPRSEMGAIIQQQQRAADLGPGGRPGTASSRGRGAAAANASSNVQDVFLGLANPTARPAPGSPVRHRHHAPVGGTGNLVFPAYVAAEQAAAHRSGVGRSTGRSQSSSIMLG